jgi:hypothetical protein
MDGSNRGGHMLPPYPRWSEVSCSNTDRDGSDFILWSFNNLRKRNHRDQWMSVTPTERLTVHRRVHPLPQIRLQPVASLPLSPIKRASENGVVETRPTGSRSDYRNGGSTRRSPHIRTCLFGKLFCTSYIRRSYPLSVPADAFVLRRDIRSNRTTACNKGHGWKLGHLKCVCFCRRKFPSQR